MKGGSIAQHISKTTESIHISLGLVVLYCRYMIYFWDMLYAHTVLTSWHFLFLFFTNGDSNVENFANNMSSGGKCAFVYNLVPAIPTHTAVQNMACPICMLLQGIIVDNSSWSTTFPRQINVLMDWK